MRSSPTSTTTGWHDLFIVKGNVGNMPDFAAARPEQPAAAARPTAASSRRRVESGLLNFQRGRGGLLVDLNGDGLLDARDRQPLGQGAAVAQRRRRHGRGAEADRPLAAAAAAPGRRQPRRDRRLGRGRGRRAGAARASRLVGGGHASGTWASCTSAWARRRRRVCVCCGRVRSRVMRHGPARGSSAAADTHYLLDRQKGLVPWQP